MTRLLFHPHVLIQSSRIDGLELSPILTAVATWMDLRPSMTVTSFSKELLPCSVSV